MRKKSRVDQMNEHARLHPSKTAGSEPIAKRIKLQQCRQCHRNLDQCYCNHIVLLSDDDESGNEDTDRKESAPMEIEQEDESNNEVPCNEDVDRKESAPMEIQQEDESNNVPGNRNHYPYKIGDTVNNFAFWKTLDNNSCPVTCEYHRVRITKITKKDVHIVYFEEKKSPTDCILKAQFELRIKNETMVYNTNDIVPRFGYLEDSGNVSFYEVQIMKIDKTNEKVKVKYISQDKSKAVTQTMPTEYFELCVKGGEITRSHNSRSNSKSSSSNSSSSSTTTTTSSSSSTTNNIATTTNSNIRGILQSYRIVQTKTGVLHEKCQHICNDESRINVTYTVKVKLHDNDRDHYEIEILHRFEDELVVTSDEDDQFESQTRRSIRQKTNKMNQDTTMSNETMGDQEMALYSKRTYKMPKESYDAIFEGDPYLYDADLHNDIIVGQSDHHRTLHLLERGHMFWYQVNNFRVWATVYDFACDTAKWCDVKVLIKYRMFALEGTEYSEWIDLKTDKDKSHPLLNTNVMELNEAFDPRNINGHRCLGESFLVLGEQHGNVIEFIPPRESTKSDKEKKRGKFKVHIEVEDEDGEVIVTGTESWHIEKVYEYMALDARRLSINKC